MLARCHDITRRAQRGGGGALFPLPPPRGAGGKARWSTSEGRMTGVAAGALADVLRVGYPVVYSAEIAGNALPGGPQIRFSFSFLFLFYFIL